MNITKLFKVGAGLALAFAKRHPKTTATLVATVVGGTVGAKIKSLADKLPDELDAL